MMKTILITGATDGIGLVTAEVLVSEGHHVIVHGRSEEKLTKLKTALEKMNPNAKIDSYLADLSDLNQVKMMASKILEEQQKIDVLINNAGVYVAKDARLGNGLDVRFVVNTIAPYLLTKLLLPLMNSTGRVVNLSSAAQATVDIKTLINGGKMADDVAYAQSKLAITMWSMQMAKDLGDKGPMIVAVNPKSFLGSKMVKEAYGMQGHDIQLGADILYRAALSDEFKDASGKYYDNDHERFMSPHPDANNEPLRKEVVTAIEEVLNKSE